MRLELGDELEGSRGRFLDFASGASETWALQDVWRALAALGSERAAVTADKSAEAMSDMLRYVSVDSGRGREESIPPQIGSLEELDARHSGHDGEFVLSRA